MTPRDRPQGEEPLRQHAAPRSTGAEGRPIASGRRRARSGTAVQIRRKPWDRMRPAPQSDGISAGKGVHGRPRRMERAESGRPIRTSCEGASSITLRRTASRCWPSFSRMSAPIERWGSVIRAFVARRSRPSMIRPVCGSTPRRSCARPESAGRDPGAGVQSPQHAAFVDRLARARKETTPMSITEGVQSPKPPQSGSTRGETPSKSELGPIARSFSPHHP